MQRSTSIDPDTATGKAKELLDGVQAALGHVVLHVLTNTFNRVAETVIKGRATCM